MLGPGADLGGVDSVAERPEGHVAYRPGHLGEACNINK